MSDAEKFVREKCQNVGVNLVGPMLNGRYHPNGGYWIVIGCASWPSGMGPTAIAAWADAANRLSGEGRTK